MHIYHFKIFTDINEDFYRYIEIQSNQTFEDLHFLLIKNLNFSDKELASFYICDNNWQKLQEITYIDMNTEILDTDDNNDEVNMIPVMGKSRLYDFLNIKTFYLELIKISQAQPGVIYPRIVKSKGEIKEHINTDVPLINEELDEQNTDFQDNDENLDEFNNDIFLDNDDNNIDIDNDDFPLSNDI